MRRDAPASAWRCLRCGFEHFQYWRARNLGAGKAIQLWRRAKIRIWTNRFAKAKDLLEEAVELWPNDPELHDDLGLCYSRLGMHDRAIEESYRAIELNPTEPRLYTNLGLRLLRKRKRNDLPQVAECVHKALELNPNFPSAHVLKRMLDEAQRDNKPQCDNELQCDNEPQRDDQPPRGFEDQ